MDAVCSICCVHLVSRSFISVLPFLKVCSSSCRFLRIRKEKERSYRWWRSRINKEWSTTCTDAQSEWTMDAEWEAFHWSSTKFPGFQTNLVMHILIVNYIYIYLVSRNLEDSIPHGFSFPFSSTRVDLILKSLDVGRAMLCMYLPLYWSFTDPCIALSVSGCSFLCI